MKAVFLDRGTFLDSIDLPAPKALSDYKVYDDTPQDKDTILERCAGMDIIITNKVKFDRELIEQLEGVRLIQLTATGKNNVDEEACKEAGIEVYNVAGYAVKSVPEHTLMLMLMALRAGVHYYRTVTEGVWRKAGQFTWMDIPLVDLEGKTLGIIGAGTIGKRVSEIAKAFGVEVLWAEHEGKKPRNDNYTKFEDVLDKSDIISLHVPLTDATHHMINKDTLAQMSQKPLVVNVARGGLVDSKAIVDAVRSGQVFGYATDVFEDEPVAKDDLLLELSEHPRVIFSPHNAWGSVSAQKFLWQTLTEQVNDFVNKNDGKHSGRGSES